MTQSLFGRSLPDERNWHENCSLFLRSFRISKGSLQVGYNELCLRAQRGSFGEISKALSGPGHAVDVVIDIREGESSPRRSSLTIEIIAEMKREQRGSSGIPGACKSGRRKRAGCCLFEANNTRVAGILA